MKKKSAALILTAAVLLTSLTACDPKDPNDGENTTATTGTDGVSGTEPPTGLSFVPEATAITRAQNVLGMSSEPGGINTHGNTSGNTNNYGIATFQGDRIFYSTHHGIFRMNNDGSDEIRINNMMGVELNVIGDWIYFVGSDRNIYRMKTNGTELEMILDGFNPVFLHAVEDWLYFSAASDEFGMSVFTMGTDGRGLRELNTAASLFLNVVGDYIYFSNADSDWRVYRMRRDGSNMRRVSDFDSEYINVVDDWIVFAYDSEDESESMNIFRSNVNERDSLVRINGDFSEDINVSGDWIFYINADDNGSVYRIGLLGDNREKLNDITSSSLSVAGDWIFYAAATTAGQRGDMFRMRLDGSENTKLT
jgi:hypothetical protein